MSFIKKIKAKSLLKKLQNYKIKIEDIDEQYLTSEMCFLAVKRNVDYFKIMSKELITQEICLYAFSNNQSLFAYIPDEFKTHKMCEQIILQDSHNIKYIPKKYRDSHIYYRVIKYLDNFMDYISYDEVSDELKRLYIDSAIKNNPDYILNFDKDDLLEYNWIEAIISKENLVFKLPDNYKNNGFFKKIININPSFISHMPLDQLSQNLFDLSFEKNPNLIKYFPDQYITREMAEYIKLYLPEYKKRIPLRYQDN